MAKSKVAVIHCDSYDPEKVYTSVSRGLELLGGIASFVKPSQSILLKPNLLNRAAPDRAATTHPVVMEAAARILADNQYTSLYYGDSPGHPGNIEKTADVCGIKTVADRYKLRFGEFSKGKTINFPEGRCAQSFEICQAALDCDAIINICKMKTHQLERITGAVKNLLGCVHGINKAKMHLKYPDPDSFGKMLVDLALFLKVPLHIMDGITAMEGNGPMSGDAININCLLISSDPVALDTVFCRLINLDPQIVPTIKFGEQYGLGTSDIEIVGDDITEFIYPSFKVQRGPAKIRLTSLGGLTQIIFAKGPVIKKSLCTKCGLCVQSCPVEGKAVNFKNNNRRKTPRFNYKSCIRCYCCQELCTEKAILAKSLFLSRMQ